ncbi:unnamed protein product [Brassica rapa subsp. trilocularis]
MRLHYTGLKCAKEYPKLETCCVWFQDRTRSIQESVVSYSVRLTIQRPYIAFAPPVSVPSLLPAHSFALDREEIPESTKHLRIHPFLILNDS